MIDTLGQVESQGKSNDWRTFSTSTFEETLVDNASKCYYLELVLPADSSEKVIFGHAIIEYQGKW